MNRQFSQKPHSWWQLIHGADDQISEIYKIYNELQRNIKDGNIVTRGKMVYVYVLFFQFVLNKKVSKVRKGLESMQ